MKEINPTMYEVETTYKSGRKRTDYITATSEAGMWDEYDKHHNKRLVENSVIVDSWLA